MSVIQNFITSAGSMLSTMQEASLADCIESSNLYMESYRVKEIVREVTKNFLLVPVIETFQETENSMEVAAPVAVAVKK